MRLLELVIAAGLAVLVASTIAAFWQGRKSYAVRASVAAVSALVDDARAVAQTSGNGATIALAGDGENGFVAALYPFRPLPSSLTTASATRTIKGNVALAPIPLGIFVSSSATVSAAPWTATDGTLATEPTCSAPIALRFDDGSYRETHSIACDDARLR